MSEDPLDRLRTKMRAGLYSKEARDPAVSGLLTECLRHTELLQQESIRNAGLRDTFRELIQHEQDRLKRISAAQIQPYLPSLRVRKAAFSERRLLDQMSDERIEELYRKSRQQVLDEITAREFLADRIHTRMTTADVWIDLIPTVLRMEAVRPLMSRVVAPLDALTSADLLQSFQWFRLRVEANVMVEEVRALLASSEESQNALGLLKLLDLLEKLTPVSLLKSAIEVLLSLRADSLFTEADVQALQRLLPSLAQAAAALQSENALWKEAIHKWRAAAGA